MDAEASKITGMPGAGFEGLKLKAATRSAAVAEPKSKLKLSKTIRIRPFFISFLFAAVGAVET